MSLSPRLNLRKLYRMSALRQALSITCAFLLLIVVAGFVALSGFERELQKHIEDELTLRFAMVNDDLENGGFDATRFPETQLERIEFNPVPLNLRDGFHNQLNFVWGVRHDTVIARGAFGAVNGKGKGQWMYLVGPAVGGQLIIGTNLGRQDDFLEIMLDTMWLVGLSAAFVALALGVFLGMRTQRRINAISITLENVGAGDLSARVAALGKRDDLDDLSYKVDATLAQLDVLMGQTRDFAANIAHDLKTPLARLRIRLDRALEAELNDGDATEGVEAAIAQTDKIIAIFDAFLRIAKLESGAAQSVFEPTDLGLLVHEVADIYDAVVEDSGRVLTVDVIDAATIHGDRVLLIQFLVNLIENALRHTPKSTEITLVAHGTTLGVVDTGPGIAPDEYDKITKPLYRLDKSRTTEGAGLGLSLVKTIATLHGAELVFATNPKLQGKGLLVQVDLGP